jgi:hypothetical protein
MHEMMPPAERHAPHTDDEHIRYRLHHHNNSQDGHGVTQKGTLAGIQPTAPKKRYVSSFLLSRLQSYEIITYVCQNDKKKCENLSKSQCVAMEN